MNKTKEISEREVLAMVQQRLPVTSPNDERAVIGCIAIAIDDDSQVELDEVLAVGPLEMYHVELVAKTLALLDDKQRKGEVVKVPSIARELSFVVGVDLGVCERFLNECLSIAYNQRHAAYHAGKVRECWIRRKVIAQSLQTIRDCYEMDDLQGMLNKNHRLMTEIEDQGANAEPLPCVNRMLNRLTAWESPEPEFIATGFNSLDREYRWIRRRAITTIGGKTSIGKSSIVNSVVPTIAKSTGVMIFSLEMESGAIDDRMISSYSSVPLGQLKYKHRQSDPVLLESTNYLGSLPIFIDDHSRSLNAILSQSRKFVRKYKVGVIFIDYLQLIVPPDQKLPRHEQVSVISRAFQAMAKQLNVSVVALSQLSRQADQGDGDPQLHHLRESGSLEQDSDVVVLLNRKRDSEDAEFIVAKNRSGKLGRVQGLFKGECCRYSEASSDFDPFPEGSDASAY